jgi:hypothetical protein
VRCAYSGDDERLDRIKYKTWGWWMVDGGCGVWGVWGVGCGVWGVGQSLRLTDNLSTPVFS